jgi:hypothetical protein
VALVCQARSARNYAQKLRDQFVQNDDKKMLDKNLAVWYNSEFRRVAGSLRTATRRQGKGGAEGIDRAPRKGGQTIFV